MADGRGDSTPMKGVSRPLPSQPSSFFRSFSILFYILIILYQVDILSQPQCRFSIGQPTFAQLLLGFGFLLCFHFNLLCVHIFFLSYAIDSSWEWPVYVHAWLITVYACMTPLFLRVLVASWPICATHAPYTPLQSLIQFYVTARGELTSTLFPHSPPSEIPAGTCTLP